MAGVSPNRMSQYGWILGFMMAALAGVLLAPTQTTGNQHRGHDPAGGQRVRRCHRWAAQEHRGDLRGRHRHRTGRELRHQLHPAPLPRNLRGHHHASPHGVPLHRPGDAAVGAAPGGGPAHHHAGAPGGGWAGVAGGRRRLLRLSPWCSAFVFANTSFKGTTLLEPGAALVMALGITGLSLVLLTGYSGQVSLCQFAFMGIGAFVMGKVAGGGLPARSAGRYRGVFLHSARDRPAHHPADATSTWPWPPSPSPTPSPPGSSPTATSTVPEASHIGRIVLPGLKLRKATPPSSSMVTAFFVLSALAGAGHPAQPVRAPPGGAERLPRRPTPQWGSTSASPRWPSSPSQPAWPVWPAPSTARSRRWVGTTDFDIFPGIIFVLFVTIWSIRTVTGAFLAAVTYVVPQPAVAQRASASSPVWGSS